MLSLTEQKDLIEIAREAISGQLLKQFRPAEERSYTDHLKSCFGAFVSIYIDRKLRGCIGTFSEEYPLHRNVRNMAISAAMSDSRFDPVDPSELDQMHIEISVLSPRIKVDDVSEIVLGKHGIFMKKGANRGTFLPQVALDQNWTREEFLGNCAKHKAGIGWEGWRTADLYIYEAFIFSSAELCS